MSINNPSKPIHTNMRSAEEQKSSMRLSIRTKITLWAGLCLALVSLILIGYSVITLRQTSIENSTREAAAIAEAKAGDVKNQLDSPLVVARTMALSLSAIKDPSIPITLSRDEINAMLRKVLIENPSFLGTYTLWEPNALDGLDAKYVGATGHDSTGRFIPYWVRGDDGIIHTEALAQYETPGAGDWYILPRSTKKEMTIAPLIYTIQGQDVVMASFIVPIVIKDKFYGIAGVDASIGFVQQLVDNIDLYEGAANAVLFTDTGTLIAVRQKPELTNQPANLIYEDFEKIRTQLDSPFTRLSPDGKYLQIFSPIDVGSENTHWVMGLIIPFEKITTPSTTAAIREVAIGAGLIVLALILLGLLAGQIVRPIQTLTNAATAVSQGDWTVRADVHSNDEAETLANAFNVMTSQLQTVFATLEQRVADRTKALATSSEVSRRLSTIINRKELVAEVVNQVNNAFGYYHTQIYFYDEANENLVMAGGTGEAGDLMLAQFHQVAKGRGLVGRAAESNAAVLVSDTSQNPEWLPNKLLPDTKSEAAIPISIGDEVLGVLDVQQNVTDGLKQEDVELLQSIANQVAVALQNARSFTQIEVQRRQNELILDTAGEGIFGLDARGNHTFVNPAAAQMLGYSIEELIGKHSHTTWHHTHADGTPFPGEECPIYFTVNKGIRTQGEEYFIRKDGTGFHVSFSSVPIQEEDRTVGAVVTFTDITQQKYEREFAAQRAKQQEALNLITQRIQNTTSVEAALQTAARELGHALGMKPTLVSLAPSALTSNQTDDAQLSQN